jgi:ribosome maturation factor RimP
MAQRSSVTVESELEQLVSAVVGDAGLELVAMALRGTGGHCVLRLDIDRAGSKGIDLGDCERVSRAVGSALDEADLIAASYQLEVSSPGTDRPLVSDDDFRRNIGRLVHIVTEDSERGRISHRGRLLAADAETLLLEIDGGESLRVPRERVVAARQDLPF